MVYLLALAFGLLSASYSPALPSDSQWFGLLCVALFLGVVFLLLSKMLLVRPGLSLSSPVVICWRLTLFVLLFICGCCWSWYYGVRLIDGQLAESLVGRDMLVHGRVVGLPAEDDQRVRFFFEVERAYVDQDALSDELLPRRLRLSWYQDSGRHSKASRSKPVSVVPGEYWQLVVRLKPPRGLVNPGGFDYQRWLLARGVNAGGYVRHSPLNRMQPGKSLHSIDRWRYQIRQGILALPDSTARPLLIALALGDKSGVDPLTWQLLQDSGTVHLLAISGLHIGLIAGAGYLMFGLLARLLSLRFPYAVFFQRWSLVGAVTFGCFYAALAGFTLPTQRALIMLLVAAVVVWRGRYQTVWYGWVLAFCLCLLLDPLAGFDAGFWLSFLAVAALLLAMRRNLVVAKLFQFIKAQWVVFVGLLLPLIFLGLPVSLLAPVINFFAIMWVGMLVVPVLLLGVVLFIFSASVAAVVWKVSAAMIEWFLVAIHWLLNTADNLSFIYKYPGELSVLYMLLMGVACLLLLVPGLRYRWLLLIAFLPLLVPQPREQPALQLTFLDVGQGVAVLIEVGERRLLYDTGPIWGRASSQKLAAEKPASSALYIRSAANSVVLPYIEFRGIGYLDKVIISHGDSDHQGGAEVVSTLLDTGSWLAGELERLPESIEAESCHGKSWSWEGVNFSVLPLPSSKGGTELAANDHSCVLSIQAFGRHILLPGDIESTREADVAGRLSEPVDVLLSPHHGSLTSSSIFFVQAIRPEHVVVSAGYRNRYGHPHARVLERYRVVGAQIFNTSETGAITVVVGRDGAIDTQAARARIARYWYRQRAVDKL
jgi:competence protein ComEC